ncbi:hypothetical protein AVEN_82658-1 [Araneus ventricosus]|uniref:Integrase catalytic domain-containing protein n=1 Tax=Araneus ventricosus TaxID=182803 RepID=A0A4Y2W0P7_ARAVE|nr:hypothetical protein AVEN_82658-1 [Araneus ventricosus]
MVQRINRSPKRTKQELKAVYSAIMAHSSKEWFWIFRTSSCNDKGHRYVLVVLMDYFTKWSEAIPIPDQKPRLWPEELARAWIFAVRRTRRYYIRIKVQILIPPSLPSSPTFDTLKTRTTALHPESDGMVEV